MTQLSAINDPRNRWRIRIDRAKELQARYPAAAPALRLYAATLNFQSDVALVSNAVMKPGASLRTRIDIRSAASQIPAILSVATQIGPEVLAKDARRLRATGEESWLRLLQSALVSDQTLNGTDDFFARA